MLTWITEQVATGGAAISPDNWRELAVTYKFTAVVNLRAEYQDVFGPPLPVGYLWLPVQDHTDPTPGQLVLGAQFIHAAAQDGHRVFVHCKMGIGRSPTLVAAYLIWTGLPADEAIRRVEKATAPLYGPVLSRFTLDEFAAILKEDMGNAA